MEDVSFVMLTILGLLAAGAPVGFILRRKKSVLKFSDKIVSLSVYVLLFLLGAGLGANEHLMAQLERMSFAAIVITAGAFTGSALAAALATRVFFGRKAFNLAADEEQS